MLYLLLALRSDSISMSDDDYAHFTHEETKVQTSELIFSTHLACERVDAERQVWPPTCVQDSRSSMVLLTRSPNCFVVSACVFCSLANETQGALQSILVKVKLEVDFKGKVILKQRYKEINVEGMRGANSLVREGKYTDSRSVRAVMWQLILTEETV